MREQLSDDIRQSLVEYSPLVQELLFARGVTDKNSASVFLSPDFNRDTHNPLLFKDMTKAVERIISALKNNERIGIFADYDADGIPGAVVLSDFFKKIEYSNVEVYIPHRNDEGYGLNKEAIDYLREKNTTLLITIDCGISDVELVSYAEGNGMNVIITDHHLPHAVLPPAYAIINPKQHDCQYPEKMLCGAGVVWKLVSALCADSYIQETYNIPLGWEKWLLDMVGIATLSDMVPLIGENRVLASYGLLVMRKSKRPGFQKLCAIVGINQSHITEDDVGFLITPRINAASRMGHPMDAFLVLSATDEVEASTLAEHLDHINNERKGVVASMVKEIKKIISEREDVLRNVIVLGNPQWKPSLLGLVANSFSDEHNRPVFLWGREEGGVCKGSCRSGGDIHIMKLMEQAKDTFIEFGGHAGAGGFSVAYEQIHTLEEILNNAFDQLAHTNGEVQATYVDKDVDVDDISFSLFDTINSFAPFGIDNPKPLFKFSQVPIASVKLFGKEKNHLELGFHKKNGKLLSAIGFFKNLDSFDVSLDVGKKIDLIFHVEKSMFRNFPEIRLRIVDII